MTLCFSKRQFKPQTHCKHKFTNKIPFHHSSVVCAVMKSKVVPACKVKKKKREFWKKKVCSYNALITASSRDRCPSLTHEIRSPLLCPVICRPHIQTYLSVNTRLLHIHSLHRGLLTCPSITVWNPRSITTECVRACALARAHLSVIKGWGVETESSCVQFELSGPSADRGLTGLSDDSQLKLSNMSASHIIQHNFTMRLYSDS